jgi:hypothetical protein
LDCQIAKEPVEAVARFATLLDGVGWGFLPTVDDFKSLPGTSLTRVAILCKIVWHGYRQLVYNLKRRRLELDAIGFILLEI